MSASEAGKRVLKSRPKVVVGISFASQTGVIFVFASMPQLRKKTGFWIMNVKTMILAARGAGRLAVVTVLSAVLTAQCNPVGRLSYYHPSRSEQDLMQDREACRNRARSAFPDRDDYLEKRPSAGEQLFRADLRRDAFDDCMMEKGWLREE